MKQKATVIGIDGKYAIVEVSRSTMCEGCHKKDCESHTCEMGSIVGATKTMRARARNPVGAAEGQTVWVETEDKIVLRYAALVFIMPVLVSLLLYGIGSRIAPEGFLSMAMALAGFVISFLFIGWIEQKNRKKEPDIVITEIMEEKKDI